MQGHIMPTIWWLWWFAVSFVVYAILFVWFWRHGRKADAENGPSEHGSLPEENG